MITKKKKPKFNVLNLGFFKSVKARWRKPRGTHNKKRMKFKWAGALPKIGYKNAAEVRGLRAGLKEVLVHNLTELEGLKNVLVRIASGVGGKKRKLLVDKAKTLGLRVVNLGGEKKEFVPRSSNGKSFKNDLDKAKKPETRKAVANKPKKGEHS
ncbi:50S ribosomal protein L32e [Candidatus Bilamarchaeum dharawalense]|uniref:50S ribosomal protein L32e n=1 Tax=Candidatus Bilamarchaeum dharawalense TaxID=2885759 RepID=A0A5E4LNR3_9ARCH|nr:50S ribosomal protein L32e [Candidatus Bilamarchaeum dharawalense]